MRGAAWLLLAACAALPPPLRALDWTGRGDAPDAAPASNATHSVVIFTPVDAAAEDRQLAAQLVRDLERVYAAERGDALVDFQVRGSGAAHLGRGLRAVHYGVVEPQRSCLVAPPAPPQAPETAYSGIVEALEDLEDLVPWINAQCGLFRRPDGGLTPGGRLLAGRPLADLSRTGVARVEAGSLSAGAFMTDFLVPQRPLVLEGAMAREGVAAAADDGLWRRLAEEGRTLQVKVSAGGDFEGVEPLAWWLDAGAGGDGRHVPPEVEAGLAARDVVVVRPAHMTVSLADLLRHIEAKKGRNDTRGGGGGGVGGIDHVEVPVGGGAIEHVEVPVEVGGAPKAPQAPQAQKTLGGLGGAKTATGAAGVVEEAPQPPAEDASRADPASAGARPLPIRPAVDADADAGADAAAAALPSLYVEYLSIPGSVPELKDLVRAPAVGAAAGLELARENLWLGDGRTVGHLHFDAFENFLCPIEGTKTVLMVDARENGMLYEGHLREAMLHYRPPARAPAPPASPFAGGSVERAELMASTSMVNSPVNPRRPDLAAYPRFRGAHVEEVTVAPGDCLFLPAYYWHHVETAPGGSGRGLAVNYWYEPFYRKPFPCADCAHRFHHELYHSSLERIAAQNATAPLP